MKQVNWSATAMRTLLVAGGLLAAASAQAQVEGSGGYFGLGAGQAMAQDYCAGEPGLTLATCDDKDTGYRIYGGYKFNRNLAIEGAYVDLGSYPASGTLLGTPFDLKVDIAGLTVQAVGMVPVGDYVTLLGRAGLIHWSIDSSGQVGGGFGSTSDDGVDLALGIGAQFNLTRNFGLRADFDLYPKLGNDDTGEEDVSMISVGAVFSF